MTRYRLPAIAALLGLLHQLGESALRLAHQTAKNRDLKPLKIDRAGEEVHANIERLFEPVICKTFCDVDISQAQLDFDQGRQDL